MPLKPAKKPAGLEYILRDVEPIFSDSSFSLESMQEVATAKQFADEINSGKLKIGAAFNHYWSYEEDAELWDLPKDREWRGLLPSWKRLLPRIAQDLSPERAEELLKVLSKNYYIAKKCLAEEKYNPFADDYWILRVIQERNPYLNKKEGKELAQSLMSRTTTYEKIVILNRLAELRYLDTNLECLMEDSKPEVRAAVARYFSRVGYLTPKVLSIIDYDKLNLALMHATMISFDVGNLNRIKSRTIQNLLHKCKPIRTSLSSKCYKEAYDDIKSLFENLTDKPRLQPMISLIAKASLKEVPEFKERVLKVLDGSNNNYKLRFVRWLYSSKCYDKDIANRIAGLLETKPSRNEKHERIREQLLCFSLYYLTEVKHYDTKVAALLTPQNSKFHLVATSLFAQLGIYHENLLPLLESNEFLVRLNVIDAMTAAGHYDKRLLEYIRKSEKNGSFCFSEFNAFTKAMEKLASPKIIMDIKEMYGLKSENKLGDIIRAVHERIKPQGYNPAVKRLQT